MPDKRIFYAINLIRMQKDSYMLQVTYRLMINGQFVRIRRYAYDGYCFTLDDQFPIWEVYAKNDLEECIVFNRPLNQSTSICPTWEDWMRRKDFIPVEIHTKVNKLALVEAIGLEVAVTYNILSIQRAEKYSKEKLKAGVLYFGVQLSVKPENISEIGSYIGKDVYLGCVRGKFYVHGICPMPKRFSGKINEANYLAIVGPSHEKT